METPPDIIFQRLALQLLPRLAKNGSNGLGQTVYVTSPLSGEGKTTVASGLAFSLATQSAERVLLVDANMDSPALSAMLPASEISVGLSDAFTARGDWHAAPLPTSRPNLWFLPVGRGAQPGLLFQREIVVRLLADLQKQFDIIVFDGAGLSRSGANAIAHAAQHLIYVLDSQTSRREVADHALRNLRTDDDRLALVVLNKKPQYIPERFYRRF